MSRKKVEPKSVLYQRTKKLVATLGVSKACQQTGMGTSYFYWLRARERGIPQKRRLNKALTEAANQPQDDNICVLIGSAAKIEALLGRVAQ